MSNDARQRAGAPTGGQFASTTHTEPAVDLTADAKPVHRFDSTGEAYNQAQYRDDIHDGDVLEIPSEGVYGFLYEAWPMAVTELHGELHSGNLEGLLADNPQYAAAAAQAKALAAAAGAPTSFVIGAGTTARMVHEWDRFDADVDAFPAVWDRKLAGAGAPQALTTSDLTRAWHAFDGDDVEVFFNAWDQYLTGADVPCPDSPDALHAVTDGSCDNCGSKNRG